jgi:hypothetical protein
MPVATPASLAKQQQDKAIDKNDAADDAKERNSSQHIAISDSCNVAVSLADYSDHLLHMSYVKQLTGSTWQALVLVWMDNLVFFNCVRSSKRCVELRVLLGAFARVLHRS